MNSPSIAVIIPCYKVGEQILSVIEQIPACVQAVYVVDDHCPQRTAELVRARCSDSRVRVIELEVNLGVGGAVMAGYKAALHDGHDILVKLDGDGQMDPALIPILCEPIVSGHADYTKGNRFFDLRKILEMPKIRIFGNALLSFFSKISSGYWHLFDPNNGYTAIHAHVASHLPMDKISRRFFFESDMLFRLNTLKAVVQDIPMDAKYGDEISNLKIKSIIFEFLAKHAKNAFKRIIYNYYLRDMTVGSLELPIGLAMLLYGFGFGAFTWMNAIAHEAATPTGTIMIPVLLILVGLNLLLAFVAGDIASVPTQVMHTRISKRRI